MDLIEKYYDDILNISTIFEDADDAFLNERKVFFNYQPTSYYFLEKLFKLFPFTNQDHLIDFGCGKGRVLFMAAYNQCKIVTGYEINKQRYDILSENVEKYQNKFGKESVINILQEDAQYVKLDDTANKFFFFNPFELKVYVKVVNNIMASFKNNERNIAIYLYRPHESTVRYLDLIEIFNKNVYIGHTFMTTDISKVDMPQFAIYSNYKMEHSLNEYSITI